MATRNADAIIERVHRLGAASVEAAPVSLRELFLATVQEQSHEETLKESNDAFV